MRQLRKRQELSLRGMAILMDRHQPGSFNLLAKLERGELRYPSINLLVDYLRACGAGFEDLLDLLKLYTSQPPLLKQKGDAAVAELLKSLPMAEQRAMIRWEKATVEAREVKAAAVPETKKPKAETDRQRVFRVVWSFIHANWNELFEQKLYEAMLKLKDEVPRSRRRDACGHARRFFGILTRWRGLCAGQRKTVSPTRPWPRSSRPRPTFTLSWRSRAVSTGSRARRRLSRAEAMHPRLRKPRRGWRWTRSVRSRIQTGLWH